MAASFVPPVFASACRSRRRVSSLTPTTLEDSSSSNNKKRSIHFFSRSRSLPDGCPGETEQLQQPQNAPEEEDMAAGIAAVAALGRRVVLGMAAGLGVAVGGNLGGITSLFLGLNVGLSRTLKLDALYPVNGFKRCLERNFEFLYPATWVGDQRLLYRAAERAEQQRLYGQPDTKSVRKASLVEPLVAFGPPGSSGELNVSVIVAPVPLDFRLDKIGDPKETGEVILKSFVASGTSKVSPTLINAEKSEEVSNGERLLYYKLEFSVEGESFSRHNVSVYVAYNGQFLSMNAQTPEVMWARVKEQFFEMANSFKVRL